MEEKTLKQIMTCAQKGKYRRYPVSRELYADAFTPVEVMRSLRAASRHCYLLESAEDRQRWGRFSFLGYDPDMEITCTDGIMTVTAGKEEEEKKSRTFPVEHPGNVFRKILEDYRTPAVEGLPPFTGGLVGYFSYDYIKYVEPSLKRVLSSGEGHLRRGCRIPGFHRKCGYLHFHTACMEKERACVRPVRGRDCGRQHP